MMSRDGITPEMIEACALKRALILAIQKLLDERMAKMQAAPGYAEEMSAQALAMRDEYLAKANAQPDEFFRGHDLVSIMTALKGIRA